MVDFNRFLASAPEAEREFRTIEVWHPDFLTTLRFVKDYTDKQFLLEDTAPRNPNETVNFQAISMELTEPGENTSGDQIMTIRLGAVANEVQDQLSQITDYLQPIRIIYRKYYSGDLSEPVLILNLAVSNVSFDSYTSVALTAEDVDFANKNSGELYTLERFVLLRNA